VLAAAAGLLLVVVAVAMWRGGMLERPERHAGAEAVEQPAALAQGDAAGSAAPAPAANAASSVTEPDGATAIGGTSQQPAEESVAAIPEAAPPPAAPVALDRLDPAWLESEHQAAWSTLAGLWQSPGQAVAIQSACGGMARTGFACLREHGSWSRIQRLGLPVLLVLHADDALFVPLRGFSDGGLLVGSEGEGLHVSRGAVEESWLGEYILAWPQAPDWPAEIRVGERGAAVDIVMQMAAFAEPPWRGEPEFDDAFESWLLAFQRRHGLKPDGIIGPITLIHLMAPTIDQPRLVSEAEEGP
jgi:general secretion pathway protein A